MNSTDMNSTDNWTSSNGCYYKKHRENERNVRKKLVDKNEIKAIIGLPENLFYGTRIPIVILIISKNRGDNNILFIDANNEFKSEKSNNYLTKEHQNKIIDVYINCREIEGYSRIVNKDEIKANGFDLSIRKYIRKKKETKSIQSKQLIKLLKNLEDERDILEQSIKDILVALNVEQFNVDELREKKKENEIYFIDKKNETYVIDEIKIGKNIKKARIEKGYTQEKLAEWLDLSVVYMSSIERGMSGMRLQLLAKICNVLDVSIEEIIR